MSATDDRPDFLMQNVASKDERWIMECSIKVEKVDIHGNERTQRTAEFNGYAVKDVVGKMLDLLKEVIA